MNWRSELEFIDHAFAKSVLKKVSSDNQSHAALLASLFALSRQGHLALDLENTGLSPELTQLIQEGAATFPEPQAWICRFGTHVYLQKNWVYETQILANLDRLHRAQPVISIASEGFDLRLNPAQKSAIENAMRYSLSLLTGGPGTGKTFTAAELVKSCLAVHPLRIVLTAPTGKAVAQLEANLRKTLAAEAQITAGTLHAVLNIKTHAYEEEEVSQLLADLILVDECSMIDAKIFARLLAAIPTGARLVLIGDKDQLPPVEAGSIFADLIDAGVYPFSHLTQCLRSDRDEILTLSRHVKEGKLDISLMESGAIPWKDEETLPQLWARFKDRFPSIQTERPAPEKLLGQLNQFTLLSCMREGALGVNAINSYFLHQYLGQAAMGTWFVAPILITRNDYDLQLFNGDLGYLVRKITPDNSLSLDDYALFHDRSGGFRQIAALANRELFFSCSPQNRPVNKIQNYINQMKFLRAMKRLPIFILLLWASFVSADIRSDIDKIIQKFDPNVHVGIEVVSLKTHEVVYEKENNHLFVPASCLKLITGAAALDLLGPDFRFETQVFTDGKIVDKVLKGNIYIKGSGDPDLSITDLENLVLQLKKRGIQSIEGNLYVDNTVFDPIANAPGWMWDDGGDFWNAPVDGLCLNHNCVEVCIGPAERSGAPALVSLFPKTDFVRVENRSQTAEEVERISATRRWMQKENVIDVTGQIAPAKEKARFALSIESPPLYVAAVFRDLLSFTGIAMNGKPLMKAVPQEATVLATHSSRALSEIVAVLMKFSDNLYADCLFKKMGEQKFGAPGTWQKGAQAVREFLSGAVGLDAEKLVVKDGSGLTRYNLVSPHHFVKLLTWAQEKFPHKDAFVCSLPVNGEKGSLQARMLSPELKGKIMAKTGGMTGITSLSGYLTTKKGQKLAFSMLLNGFVGNGEEYSTQIEDAICAYLVNLDL
ncbi:MAG: D-alanyl-D-alanine carboxypeptidase/D-alanyl-D-alanine-endopeptidase [Candidatus Melainabacteria bacterium]|nr:D-alanyl-D-alanine carboxypeptidase/D-alanyl-D-alanine-endopeptidase [Candidatus Melainabacteria bacterium]